MLCGGPNMNRFPLLAALAAPIACLACADRIPEPPPAAPATTYRVALGSATGVQPGVTVGYSVTAIAPNTFRVYWTGDARVTGDGFREFSGSLTTDGRFVAVAPGCANAACHLEDGDWVSGSVQRIDWDTYASVGLDGFDVTTDGAPAYLDVFVDGIRRADLVYLGSAGGAIHPTAAPFAIVAP